MLLLLLPTELPERMPLRSPIVCWSDELLAVVVERMSPVAVRCLPNAVDRRSRRTLCRTNTDLKGRATCERMGKREGVETMFGRREVLLRMLLVGIGGYVT